MTTITNNMKTAFMFSNAFSALCHNVIFVSIVCSRVEISSDKNRVLSIL
jgi:hypothetical protein